VWVGVCLCEVGGYLCLHLCEMSVYVE